MGMGVCSNPIRLRKLRSGKQRSFSEARGFWLAMRSLVSLALIVLALLTPELARAAPGEPVRSFGRAGLATLPLGSDSPDVRLVAQQPGGRIVVAALLSGDRGWHDPSLAVFGLRPDGTPDHGFGRRGRLAGERPAGAATLLPDGKLLLAHSTPRSLSRSWLRLTRFTAAGRRDRGFGTNGQLRLPLVDTPGAAVEVAVAPDGKLVVVATSGQDDRRDPLMLLRLTADGALDPSFGAGGRMLLPAGDDLTALQVAVQRSGRIVVLADVRSYAGLGGTGVALLGVRPDGTLDPDFGGYGDGMRALVEPSARMALAHDDEIVLLLTRERFPGGATDATVLRLPADAAGPARETTFPSQTGTSAGQLALDERGAAVVSGGEHYSATPYGAMRGFVARFGRDAFDAGFRTDVPDRRLLWTSTGAGPLAVLSDGTILASANQANDEGLKGAIKLLRLHGGYDTAAPTLAARVSCHRGAGMLSVVSGDASPLTSLDVRAGARLLRRSTRPRLRLRVPPRRRLTVQAIDASGNVATRRLAGSRCGR
jgi:uncharacterized delta-60 repeat protein